MHTCAQCHVECLTTNQEWRDQRQALNAENSRLNEELHLALERCTRFEADGRRKDLTLAEARAKADSLTKAYASVEAELRHRDQLLREAGTERKRAWENASAETAKAAARRAGAAAREADSLRGQVQLKDRTAATVNDRYRLVADLEPTEDEEAWDKRRLSWGPQSGTSTSGALVERNRDQRRSCSPKLRSMSIGEDARGALGPDPGAFSKEWNSHKALAYAARPPPPPLKADTTPLQDTTLGRGNEGSPQREVRRSPSDLVNARESRSSLRPEQRMGKHAGNETPLTRTSGREQCRNGERERHDSEGMRAALTAARPEWAETLVNTPLDVTTGAYDHARHIAPSSWVKQERAEDDGRDRGQSQRDRGGGSRESGFGAHGQTLREQWHGRNNEWKGEQGPLERTPPVLDVPGGTLSPRNFPAAGQRRGRDEMSSRRSSLSGAGVGVHSETSARRSEPKRGEGWQGLSPPIATIRSGDGSPFSYKQDAFAGRDVPLSAVPLGATGDIDMTNSTPANVHMNKEATASSTPGSLGPLPTTLSLADIFCSNEKGAPVIEEQPSRRERTSIPFATEAVEAELRPVRELERQLMALQMEASQVCSTIWDAI